MSLLRRIDKSGTKIRIVVIGKCEIIEDGQSLATLIQQQSQTELVGIFETGHQAIEKMLALSPDIVIIDMALSDMDGLAALTHMRKIVTKAKYVLALTVNNLVIAKAGIVDSPDCFLVKPVLSNDFIKLIHEISVVKPNDGKNSSMFDLQLPDAQVQEAKLAAMRQRRQALAEQQRLGGADKANSYIDLKTLIKNKILSELDVQGMDAPRKSDVRAQIEELFNAILADENFILSRAERMRLFESIISETLSPAQTVQFSCYFPKDVTPNQRFGLHFYAHLQSEDIVKQVAQDVEKFSDELAGNIAKPKTANPTIQLETGMLLTVIPECDELEFDPPELSKKWHGDWTRFSFDFRAKPEHINDTLFVRVSVQVAGIEIAHIKCAIEVANEKPPILNIRYTTKTQTDVTFETKTVNPYQRIFISYSHKDSKVAQLYKTAQVALGNEVFLDVDSLRAGENWKNALAKAIDSADILQLFWSENSANSEYCRYEWDYALQHKCPDNRCETFIRPVYWQQPMPQPPTELEHLNFKYAPFQDETSR